MIPPDKERCQALVPNRTWSPFNLGPADTDSSGRKHGGSRRQDRLYRCVETPVCIVEEIEPGEDGLRGSMSLCADCFVQLMLQENGRARLLEDLTDGSSAR